MKVAKEEALFKAVKIDIMCGKLTALQRGGVCSDKRADKCYSSRLEHQ